MLAGPSAERGAGEDRAVLDRHARRAGRVSAIAFASRTVRVLGDRVAAELHHGVSAGLRSVGYRAAVVLVYDADCVGDDAALYDEVEVAVAAGLGHDVLLGLESGRLVNGGVRPCNERDDGLAVAEHLVVVGRHGRAEGDDGPGDVCREGVGRKRARRPVVRGRDDRDALKAVRRLELVLVVHDDLDRSDAAAYAVAHVVRLSDDERVVGESMDDERVHAVGEGVREDRAPGFASGDRGRSVAHVHDSVDVVRRELPLRTDRRVGVEIDIDRVLRGEVIDARHLDSGVDGGVVEVVDEAVEERGRRGLGVALSVVVAAARVDVQRHGGIRRPVGVAERERALAHGRIRPADAVAHRVKPVGDGRDALPRAPSDGRVAVALVRAEVYGDRLEAPDRQRVADKRPLAVENGVAEDQRRHRAGDRRRELERRLDIRREPYDRPLAEVQRSADRVPAVDADDVRADRAAGQRERRAVRHAEVYRLDRDSARGQRQRRVRRDDHLQRLPGIVGRQLRREERRREVGVAGDRRRIDRLENAKRDILLAVHEFRAVVLVDSVQEERADPSVRVRVRRRAPLGDHIRPLVELRDVVDPDHAGRGESADSVVDSRIARIDGKRLAVVHVELHVREREVLRRLRREPLVGEERDAVDLQSVPDERPLLLIDGSADRDRRQRLAAPLEARLVSAVEALHGVAEVERRSVARAAVGVGLVGEEHVAVPGLRGGRILVVRREVPRSRVERPVLCVVQERALHLGAALGPAYRADRVLVRR